MEKRINQGLRSCGCATAAVFLCVAIVSLCLTFYKDAKTLGNTVGARVLVASAILISATLLGKMVGLLIAEIRLRRAIRELINGTI